MVEINLSSINRINIEQGDGSTAITFSDWRGSETTITMGTFTAYLLTEKLNEASSADLKGGIHIEYTEYRDKMKEYGCGKMTVPFVAWQALRDFDAMTNKIREANKTNENN